MSFYRCISLLSCLVLAGCNPIQTRIDSANDLTDDSGFIKEVISTSHFKLVSYQNITLTDTAGTFYIEGDGLAWLSRKRVSPNPTPKNPVALKLALNDPSANVIYLARPCQYVDLKTEKQCHSDYWTTKRFAPEVVASMGEAITQIKQSAKLNKIRLVGYSGGGAIAAMLAATRNDVIDLRTVAGNLDIALFAQVHNVTPLTGSLNPVDFVKDLVAIPQTHFVGLDDNVIPTKIAESYKDRFARFDVNLRCFSIHKVDNASHSSGWLKNWDRLVNLSIRCKR